MCSPLKGLLLIVPLKATRDKWRFRVCLHSVQFVSAVQYVAHHGDRLRGVQRQLYERISRRNRNRIRKYLSQFIRGPDGVDHEKNGGRKSRDTLPFNLIPGCRVSPRKKKKSPILTFLQYISTVYTPPLYESIYCTIKKYWNMRVFQNTLKTSWDCMTIPIHIQYISYCRTVILVAGLP